MPPAVQSGNSRTSEPGVAINLLDPKLELFLQRAGAGFGYEDISGILELIRRKSAAASPAVDRAAIDEGPH